MLGCDYGKRREREKMVPMTDISTTTEVDELQRLRELKTRLDMARGEGVSGSGFIRALGGHADGFESCQANDAIELLVP